MLDLPVLLPDLPPGLPVDPSSFLPPAEALVDAFAAARSGPGLAAALALHSCPAAELLSTVASARAGLLALRIGRSFTHHELRLRLPMPDDLRPEVPVWRGDTLPVWSDGVLAEPKYFSFFQDDPHSPFNPNHRARWRAHELLHGVVGWYWHPEMSRLQACLGARLGELLPVLHWYGLDELGRPRCARHRFASARRDLCLSCEALALRPFDARPADREADLERARWSEEHLAREWSACLRMLQTGRPVGSAVPGIDALSDAEGYLRGHWNRLTAWSFGAWVERFCVDGLDYSSTLPALAERVARTTLALCSGPLSAEEPTFRRLRARKALQDLGYRLLLVLEHAGGDETELEARLMPEVDALAEEAQRLRSDGAEEEAARAIRRALDVVEELGPALPEGLAPRVGAMGLRFLLREAQIDLGLDQLIEGLQDALPDTWSGMPEPEEVAARFADSPHFDRSGSLCRRFAAWWREEGGADADLVELEALVRDLPHEDPEAELYAVLLPAPPPPGRGEHRLNRTLRRAWLDEGALDAEDLEGVDRFDEAGRVEVAVAWLAGSPRVLVLDQALAAALDAVAEGRVPELGPWARLVESGHVITWEAP